MSNKSRRHIKKHLVKVFEQAYDIKQFDYARRSKLAKQEARLIGVIAAGALYMAAFGLAYFAWRAGTVHEETLMRFSWIFMVPATAVGGFAYLFAYNRREYAVGQDIINRALLAEGEEGLLWRFGPLLAELAPDNAHMPPLIALSKEGAMARAEPEDCSTAVQCIHQALTEAGTRRFSEETAAQLDHNFNEP